MRMPTDFSLKAFIRALTEAAERPRERGGATPLYREGSGRRSLWTVWRDVFRGSRYSNRDLRRLRAERGVGRPPAVLAARRRQELEELAA